MAECGGVSHRNPDFSLRLEWVYGYRSHQCRDNARYLNNGEIVYFVATVGIVLNAREKRQRFYHGHNDDVISIAQHRQSGIVATGQLGQAPFICVWDPVTMETLSILAHGHHVGISAIDFDEEGSRLLSAGMEERPRINIWDWKKGRVYATLEDDCGRILLVRFGTQSNENFVSVGLKSIKFWKRCASWLSGTDADYGVGGVVQTMLCAAFGSDGWLYSGGLNGDVYAWKSKVLDHIMKDVHRGGVIVMQRTLEDKYVTGGKDGCVQLWSNDFKPLTRIDLNYTAENGKGLAIRSVHWIGDRILVGVSTNRIYEVSSRATSDVECIVHGPEEGPTSTLALHPHKQLFAVGGNSGVIRLFNYTDNQLTNHVTLRTAITSACFHPNGYQLAVGFADGSIAVLKIPELCESNHVHDSAELIRVLKYSPDGSFLAAGSDDGLIYVYSAYHSYKKLHQCAGGVSPIVSLDWSVNGAYLQADTANHDWLVYRVHEGQLVMDKHERLSTKWDSWTSVAGPDAAGVWDKHDDATRAFAIDAYADVGVMVIGNADGAVELLGYPSLSRGARGRIYSGHSTSGVSDVKFSCDKSRIISIGSRDSAIFQWNFGGHGGSNASSPNDNFAIKVRGDSVDNATDDEEADFIDSDVEREIQTCYGRFHREKEDIRRLNLTATLNDPSSDGRGKRKVPSEGLQLGFVFGYRGFDCRNNVCFTQFGAVVYHVATVGVVFTKETHKQRFYLQHDDDILCIDLHPNKDYVATGQAGENAAIHIWDALSLQTLSILKHSKKHGVGSVQFSSCGKLLVSATLNKTHDVTVFNWKRGEKLAFACGQKHKIMSIKWNPLELNKFVTVGIKHLKFWTLSGSGLLYRRAVFDPVGRRESMMSAAYGKSVGICYTGGVSGRMYVWDGNVLIRTIQAHDGPVFCLKNIDKGYLTGGKDGIVQLWDDHLERCLRTYPVSKSYAMVGCRGQLVRDRPAIRACAQSHGKIVVGTASGELLMLEKTGCFQILVQGHASESLWALDTHPSRNAVATLGGDRTLRTWDLNLEQMVAHKSVSKYGRCLVYSQDGRSLVAGYQDGSFQILNSESLDTVEVIQRRQLEITVLKFSPTPSHYLAIGYESGLIDIYNHAIWKWVTVCNTGCERIRSVDWNSIGNLIHVSTTCEQQFFYEVPSGAEHLVPPEHQQKLEWATWTSSVALNCEKLWTPTGSRLDVNGTCLSGDRHLLAVADNFGFLRLLDFPITMRNPKTKWYFGQGTGSTAVKWTCDDNRLITINQSDSAILVWNRRVPMVDRKLEYDSDETDSDDLEDGFDSDVENQVHAMSNFHIHRKEAQLAVAAATAGAYSTTCQIPIDHTTKPVQVPHLELDVAFGYQGSRRGDNVHYINEGQEVVYPVAAVIVIMNIVTGHQNFYTKHTDTISCMTTNHHPSFPGTIASGQLSGQPAIHVWTSSNKRAISLLRVTDNAGIASLSFSGNGKLLLAVGLDAGHTFTVWRWEDGELLVTVSGIRRHIFAAKFRPDSDIQFVSVGVKHVQFWSVTGERALRRRGVIGGETEADAELNLGTMLSLTFGKHDITFTGASNGNIYVWRNHFLQRVIVKAHAGPIFCMHLTLRDGLITTGSKQCVGSNLDEAATKLWDPEMKRCRPFPLRCQDSDIIIKSVCRCKGKILAGSLDNSIYEITEKTGFVRELINSHRHDGIKGLACHPRKQVIATAGDDRTVRIWDVANKRLKATVAIPSAGSALHFSPDGELLAVGLENGLIILLQFSSQKILAKKRIHDHCITDLKFASSNKILAAASASGRVDIYSIHPVAHHLTQIGRWIGPSPRRLKVDFSTDHQYLMVSDFSYNHLILQLPDGFPVLTTDAIFKTKWATLSLLNPEPSNPFRKVVKRENALVTCTSMSDKRTAIILGTSQGTIQMAVNQIDGPKVTYLIRTGHSSPLTRIGFTSGGQNLVTVSALDNSIFIWKVLN